MFSQIESKTKFSDPGDIFRLSEQKKADPVLREELGEFSLLSVNPEHYSSLLAASPEEWEMLLPSALPDQPALHLRLRPNHFLASGFRLRAASGAPVDPRTFLGHHYVGEVVGVPGSRVALSLLEEEVTATISQPGRERLALGRLRTQQKSATETLYVLFPDRQLQDRQELDCATPDSGIGYSDKELQTSEAKNTGGCVEVFFEVDYDIFFDKGSIAAAAAHVVANFNEVSILYDEINVNLEISELLVWDQPSPYFGTSSSAMLTQFQSNRTSFNGDLAQLVSYQASGGIAVLDGLCHPFSSARMSFSSIHPNFLSVPLYSWSTMVIAHELGHLLGSQHTHACVWNGNNTAIDGCPGWTEGFCGTPGIPASGGTIMSYCHLTPVGINFELGFGDQPTAVIQNRVAAAQDCVQASCASPPDNGGGDDGEDDDDDDEPAIVCDAQTVYLKLTLDDFGMETTWDLRAEGGAVLATGGPYPKKQKGRVIRDTICVSDGCYLFTIRDSDNDGICCEYGNGSFELTDSTGTILGSGGTFDTLDIVDFCLPDIPPVDDSNCLTINFEKEPVMSYGTNQDAGSAEIQEDGEILVLRNNAWKAVEYPYTVTPDTWLSFWFKSTRKGEVHGIGLDDNMVISSNLTFRLYGTQSWGIGDFSSYDGSGEWEYYEIPVGQYYEGEATYLFFAADHDVGSRDGNSYFRDVNLSEGGPCLGEEQLPAPGSSLLEEEGLRIYPNPVDDQLEIRTPADAGTIQYQVLDLTGRELQAGNFSGTSWSVKVSQLPAGSYLLRLEGDRLSESKKFTVVH
ncbi:M12 family metallo-peptidase [Lewinella sp. W8]|uniref:M12 family metallo-peptidase n=1 Tax=Lewinella sp. W8 TaxID=2528208 RepID=UPI0015668086